MSERIVVLGAGESGTGAALLAKSKGLNVFVSDQGQIPQIYKDQLLAAEIAFEEGGHNDNLLEGTTEVVKSPGIPESAPVVDQFLQQGIAVISELEFASRYTNAKMIAITGTNGKTTTTLLTHHILSSAGFNVGLAGNVGHSLAKLVIDDKYDYYVVEVSSFQLDGMFNFKADIAVLLNITKDHLNRYDNDFSKYVASKFRITQNMTSQDCFIYFADDQAITSELSRQQLEAAKFAVSLVELHKQGAYALDDSLWFDLNLPQSPLKIAQSEISITGPHNMVNAMAAALSALLLEVPLDQLITALGDFKNTPHRLEMTAEINQVSYINDSKATNVDAVYYALQSFDQPIVWIAGGVDKGNNYQQIAALVHQKVKALVCLGTNNQPLLSAFEGQLESIVEVQDMQSAVNEAARLADPGDVVLLSPACASFDLFKNYQDRGDQFKQVVEHKKKELAISVLA